MMVMISYSMTLFGYITFFITKHCKLENAVYSVSAERARLSNPSVTLDRGCDVTTCAFPEI